MEHLVVGAGEVGTALAGILSAPLHDPKQGHTATGTCRYLHIAFPYSKTFTKDVKGYIKEFDAEFTVIHSTVPIGTNDELGTVASPIRGVHPHLERGIRSFLKYFGGPEGGLAAKPFTERNIPCQHIKDNRTVEALKLLDTLQYGLLIKMEKEIWKWCKDNDVDPLIAYAHANKSYNDGYTALDKPNVVRPWLVEMPGKIGGHCVIENAHLIDFHLAKELIKFNNSLETVDTVEEGTEVS